MRGSLASRFPTVARLLNIAPDAPLDDEDDDDGQADGGDGDGDGDDGSEAKPDPKPGESGDDHEAGGASDEDDGNDDDDGADGSSGAPAGNQSASGGDPSHAQLLAGFERDADALVAAERTRCVAVFTSPAGMRNPTGAATILGDTDLPADKAIAVLNGTAANANPRDRLRLSAAVRPNTGAATDRAAAATDVVSQKKEERRKKAAAAVKRGGKRVGGPIDESNA